MVCTGGGGGFEELSSLLTLLPNQKCDGNQPTCNQCVRFNRVQNCQYVEGPTPSTTRQLEQQIAQLESRISELEHDDPSSIRLHNPYRNPCPSLSAETRISYREDWWEIPEPPLQVAHVLFV